VGTLFFGYDFANLILLLKEKNSVYLKKTTLNKQTSSLSTAANKPCQLNHKFVNTGGWLRCRIITMKVKERKKCERKGPPKKLMGL